MKKFSYQFPLFVQNNKDFVERFYKLLEIFSNKDINCVLYDKNNEEKYNLFVKVLLNIGVTELEKDYPEEYPQIIKKDTHKSTVFIKTLRKAFNGDRTEFSSKGDECLEKDVPDIYQKLTYIIGEMRNLNFNLRDIKIELNSLTKGMDKYTENHQEASVRQMELLEQKLEKTCENLITIEKILAEKR